MERTQVKSIEAEAGELTDKETLDQADEVPPEALVQDEQQVEKGDETPPDDTEQ